MQNRRRAWGGGRPRVRASGPPCFAVMPSVPWARAGPRLGPLPQGPPCRRCLPALSSCYPLMSAVGLGIAWFAPRTPWFFCLAATENSPPHSVVYVSQSFCEQDQCLTVIGLIDRNWSIKGKWVVDTHTPHYCRKTICTPVFTTALYIITMIEKQPEFPSLDK